MNHDDELYNIDDIIYNIYILQYNIHVILYIYICICCKPLQVILVHQELRLDRSVAPFRPSASASASRAAPPGRPAPDAP